MDVSSSLVRVSGSHDVAKRSMCDANSSNASLCARLTPPPPVAPGGTLAPAALLSPAGGCELLLCPMDGSAGVEDDALTALFDEVYEEISA